MRIAVGSDHVGLELKLKTIAFLKRIGVTAEDIGTHTADRCDYPRYAAKVGNMVVNGEADRGLLFCGTGAGMCIAAIRLKELGV